MLKCDLDINALVVEGQEFTITRQEMADHAEAYAAMLIWQMLNNRDYSQELLKMLVPVMIEYARKGEGFVSGPHASLTMGQSGDWCACIKHFSDWQTFKAMFGKVNQE